MSSRPREFGEVVLYFLVVGVTTPTVTRTLSQAYDDRELVFETVLFVIETLGVNIDLAVVLPAWILVGWVILFALDEYKQLQRVLIGLAAVVFVWRLSLLGKWVETVSWGLYWWGAVIGLVVGLLTGLRKAMLPQGEGRRSFPAAARYLYGAVYVAVVVGLLEYYIDFGSFALETGRSLFPLPASLLFLVAINEFVRYSDKREVVIIGGNTVPRASFIGGLFTATRERYDDVSTTGGTGEVFLTKAANRKSKEDLERLDVPEAVQFQFASDSLLPRRVIVDASQYTPPSERELASIRQRVEQSGDTWVRMLVRRGLVALLPHRLFESSSRRTVERIVTADTVLLLAPMSDFVNERALEESERNVEWESLLRRDPPQYLDTYRELCEGCGENKEILIVATEADAAMDVYERKENTRQLIQNRDFRMFIETRVLSRDSDQWPRACEVWPVVRSFDDEPSEGFDQLVEQL